MTTNTIEPEATALEVERETPSSVFEARKNELLKTKSAWRNWFLVNIFLLLILGVAALLALLANVALMPVLLFVLVFAVPLAYSAIFFHAQHNRDREYLEEYSFKSMAARSVEAYRLLLKEDIDPANSDQQKKFLDFIIDSAKNLNTSPRATISKNPVRNEEDIPVGVVEKLADVFKKFIP